MPLPENPERVPSVALTSDSVKFDDHSFRLIATLTEDPAVTDVAVTVAEGAVVSTTIAFAPAMLFEPDGTVVEVIELPAASVTVPTTKLETVRSDEFWLAPIVYVPVSVVPVDAALNNTVAPVFSVTVNELPDCTASLIVAVTFTDCPARYEPSAVVDENDDTDGAVESFVRVMVRDWSAAAIEASVERPPISAT